jgi:DNA-binding NarL/FixJ family response regulator
MQAGEAIAILEQMPPETELGVDTFDLLETVGGLTCRESEVLRHMAKGETIKEIADALFVTLNTVRNHIAKILNKTGTHSTREAVVMAVSRGLLTVDELGREKDVELVLTLPTREHRSQIGNS